MFSWAWSYFTYDRGARLITGIDHAALPRSSQATDVTMSSVAGE
jgi:hypothetical protein